MDAEKIGRIVKDKLIHIYGQLMWHEDIYIVGTKESLSRLRDALDVAILAKTACCSAIVNDGEGYDIFVIIDERILQDNYGVPYSSDYAKEKNKDALFPWTKNE